MLANYIKIAWRNLIRNKAFSFINVFGMSAGLVCCMLLAIYLLYEFNYDSYHKNIKDFYQVATTVVTQHKEESWATTPAPMAPTLKKEFSEIEASTRLLPLLFEDKTLIQYNKSDGVPVSFYETKGFLADSSFFRMFTYDFIEGDANSALNAPATVVISEDIARKIFGNAPALNKVVRINSGTNGDHDFTITGVFRPMSTASHIEGRFFLSMMGGKVESFLQRQANDFASNNMFYTYVILKNGTDPDKLERQFPAFIEKYASHDLKAMGFEKKQFLVPVRDIHLRSDLAGNVSASTSTTYLYILGSISLFTLLIACFNFMNLATARSTKRSAEVGVRKVLGAERKGLMIQFLGESVLMSFFAFLLAWGLSLILLPTFSAVTEKHLSLSLSHQLPLIIGFLVLSIMTGLLAGIYPAFYMASFRPVQVLKGKFKNSLGALSLRKGLVIFQFVISVVLIISSLVIDDQMQFMRTKNLGFEKERQIILPLRSKSAKNAYPYLKSEIAGNRQVISVGASRYYPGIINPADKLLYPEGQGVSAAKRIRMNFVDPGYLRTLDIKAAAGHIFSEEYMSDTSNHMILNESAIHSMGFATPEKAVGKHIYSTYQGNSTEYTIVGVVKDFHFEDLHVPIAPYGFELYTDPTYNYFVVHAGPGNISNLIKFLAGVWQKADPSSPFEYSFLDEDFQKNYKAEVRLSEIIRYFTIMAILISCLGLFGLASFSAEQRIREIGIRKVLGSSASGIVSLLSRDFLKLVFIASLIASPIAWFIMHKWLDDFAFRTPIHWTVFLVTIALALAISMLTISFQAVRAALANPIKSLKSE
ncbi:ABC transporter permease [Flavitalea sp. BT771]|uniref:ABC transporter permease n=1 Tax=Flavitalea sp. BT771 TaxID=3063329 RepID=UPI0026E32BB5|nr:ABC transporter permease [Flavitalea sp. BT771]MDO6434607.1 ABC transporter permease [Flavitalea sp. BT771]MDV6223507.1 ABC transporter permease [Flavitalea sp. BT771]